MRFHRGPRFAEAVRFRTSLAAAFLLAAQMTIAEEKASHQVSPFAGSLSYSIPIEAPPFHGLEPRLALAYSSEGRNGFAGVGWGLAGFSTIERVNPGRGAAFMDASDAYLLDGQKLVACQPGSVSPSCTTGGTHSTEVESYLRIKRDGDSWFVWGKDGTRTEFAPVYVVPPSAFLPGGILRWGQTQVIDTHGNEVTYLWAVADGDAYPSAVLYNGYGISLFREARPDVIKFGASTIVGSTVHRLKSLFVYRSGDSQIRAYKLGYTTSALTGRSLLASVQQFGKDVTFDPGTGEILSGTSLPAQTYTYQGDAIGKTFQPLASAEWCQTGVHVTGDFNGDGRTDRACTNFGTYIGFEVSLATGTGFASPVMWLNHGFAHPLVADFNSDGRSDVAEYLDWSGEVFVARSNGSGLDPLSTTAWGSFTVNGRSCAFNQGVIGTGDFNGDGVTDMSCRNYVTRDIFVALSTKTSFGVALWSDLACDQYSEITGALDFDGNGLDDWYCIGVNGDERFYVFPSTGQGFIWPAFGSLNTTFCPHEYYVFGDVNADGRADATCVVNGKVALSTGRDFVIATSPSGGFCAGSNPNVFAADVDGDGASEIVCNNAGGGPGDIQVRKWTGTSLGPAENWKDDWCTGAVGGGDFNGDGKTDLYCNSAATPVAVAGTGGLQADLVSSISNGLGGVTQVGYTPSSAFSNVNNPSTKHVITSVTRLDGRGGSSTSTFSYADSKMDRKERKFLGFRQMTEHSPCLPGETECPYIATNMEQDLAAAGRPTQITRRVGASKRLHRTSFDYATNLSSVPMTSLLVGESVTFYDETGVQCAPPCPNNRRSSAEHLYDQYGNRVQTISRGDEGITGDETTTVWTYLPNTTSYVVDRAAVRLVFAGVGTAGQKLTENNYFYDSQESALPPIKGDVTKAWGWLDTENRWIPRSMAYDQWGNLVSLVDETQRVTSYEYDETHHVYPTAVINGEQERSSTVWDYVCGVPTEVRDANQVEQTKTSIQYDPLCRTSLTTYPLGATEARLYQDFGLPNAQRVRVETPSPTGTGVHQVSRYFDGFGRTWKTLSTGPTPSQSIVTETQFNVRGLVAATAAPRYGNDPAFWTSYAHDARDRVISVTFPDAEQISKSYGLLSETTTDEHGHPVTTRFDVQGRRIATEQTHNSQVLSTTYGYDLLGRMDVMTDAAGNSWAWDYDSLGRLVEKDDPDAGSWMYEHDDAGRVARQVDAKRQHTEFTYDQAGRIATKTTRVTALAAGETTTFTRNQDRPGYFNRGQVTSIASASPAATPIDSQTFDYDAGGRLVQQGRQFDGLSFTAQWRFDPSGRLRGMTYPDGYAVGIPGNELQYDAAGRLLSAPGIINGVLYDAAGRVLTQNNANTTQTVKTYSAERGFLTGITTTGGAGAVQGLTYTPDPVGLLELVTSSSPFQRESWDYAYDDLHRLTGAVSLTHPGEDSQSFEYDGVGRMTFNSKVGTYSYPNVGLPRPHAPTLVGSHPEFQYDDNGNLESGAGRAIQWSVDNMPTQINAVQFLYGATRDRIKKSSASGTSYYPLGDDYEVTDSDATKYISLPGVGLVAKHTSAGTFWLHSDRLGSIQAITSASGTVVQRMTYRPYGDKIVDETSHVEARGYIDQRQDEDTGLTYLHGRYYDAALGIFLSVDPLHPAEGGLDRYAYGADDPINSSDRSGLNECVESVTWSSRGPLGGIDGGSSTTSVSAPAGMSCVGSGPGSFLWLGGGFEWSADLRAERRQARGDAKREAAVEAVVAPTADPPADPPAAPTANGPRRPTNRLGALMSRNEGLRYRLEWSEHFLEALPDAFWGQFEDGGCGKLFFSSTRDALFPLTASAATAAEPIASVAGARAYDAAFEYAASRGLRYPMKSSVYRGMLSAANARAGAGPLIGANLAIYQGLFTEMRALSQGQCR